MAPCGNTTDRTSGFYGGWVKSYHDDTAFWAIGVLVLCSMGLSVFLVFYSKETWWNIVRQSLIPGLFIVYWIAKNRGWIGRSKPTLPVSE